MVFSSILPFARAESQLDLYWEHHVEACYLTANETKQGAAVMKGSHYWKPVTALAVLVIMLATVPLAMAAPPAQGTAPVVVINTAALNQRTGPGPQFATQGVLPGGAIVPVVGRTQSRDWWQIDSEFGIGWVSNEFVLTQGDFRNVPVVTEYGVLEAPLAIIVGYPVPVYALPNPGSQVIGAAPGEARFPILGRSYHPGTETWYLLVETQSGHGWLAEDEGLAIFGFGGNIFTLSTDEAFDLPRPTPVAGGVVLPPEPTPVPDAPTAPPPAPTEAAGAGGDTSASGGSTTTATPVPARAADQTRLTGDCYALPLVNFLLQTSPVRATGLACTDTARGATSVTLGLAEVSMAVDGSCGAAAQTPIATLVDEAGAGRHLSFCTAAAPNATTSAFLNWVKSPAGAAAISAYRGLPGSPVPQYAVPVG
jgi:uncharacterized protein YraI